jgi:general secretion pathway protein G
MSRSIPRSRESGFTLIELLIVVAIIAIIAGIAMISYLMALDRARQKRTVNDMRIIAIAWEARATETQTYAAAGYAYPAGPVTAAELQARLVPTYTRNFPREDGWGQPFDFALGTGPATKDYAIRSRGKDGVAEDAANVTPGETPNPDCDIIYANGTFITYPASAQGK